MRIRGILERMRAGGPRAPQNDRVFRRTRGNGRTRGDGLPGGIGWLRGRARFLRLAARHGRDGYYCDDPFHGFGLALRGSWATSSCGRNVAAARLKPQRSATATARIGRSKKVGAETIERRAGGRKRRARTSLFRELVEHVAHD